MNNTAKRLFFLMLSANSGQEFARTMGFSPPSEDVEEVELEDILSRWAVFLHYGLVDEIDEASDWFTEFLQVTDKLISEVEEFKSILTVYGVAMLNKLMESEKLAFVIPIGGINE